MLYEFPTGVSLALISNSNGSSKTVMVAHLGCNPQDYPIGPTPWYNCLQPFSADEHVGRRSGGGAILQHVQLAASGRQPGAVLRLPRSNARQRVAHKQLRRLVLAKHHVHHAALKFAVEDRHGDTARKPAARIPPRPPSETCCGRALLLALLAGAASLAVRAAIEHRPRAAGQRQAEAARLEMDYQLGTKSGSAAGSLQEILAHPVLIPSHSHPLLGRHAPEFQLDDLDGKTWKLNELLADGPVVVIFYHAYCDLCARQLFADERDLPLFRAVGTRLVAISADPPALARQRFARYGWFGFPVLWDPGNRVAEAYQVFRRAQDEATTGELLHGTFIIDSHGTVRWVNIGDGPFRCNPALISKLATLQGLLPATTAKP